MTSLKSISMSELAKRGEGRGLGVVKSGVSKIKEGEFLDPFELGVPYPVEFTDQKATRRPTGTPQVQLSVAIMMEDGSLEQAGRVWIDLPVKEALSDLPFSAQDEATFLQKAGERLLKFLRAIDPERYKVFETIDKSDPKNWKWLDAQGKVLDAATREQRADEIDAAVVGIAEGIWQDKISLKGSRCIVTKQPNPHAPKYPYVNYTAFPTE